MDWHAIYIIAAYLAGGPVKGSPAGTVRLAGQADPAETSDIKQRNRVTACAQASAREPLFCTCAAARSLARWRT